MAETCRWGFLSTAEIGQKNWQAIFKSGNGRLTAVASRGAERAQAFIDGCQRQFPFQSPPEAVGSYEELLSRDDVDAVYVPLPTGMRREWVIKAAEAGKHVLCEKPCAPSVEDLSEMVEACRAHGVQFMDGVMYVHSDRLKRVRQVLQDSTTVGQIKRIACQFSFCGPEEFRQHNIRTNSTLEPHGCLGDLGWYTIRFALWTMEGRLPQSVTGRMLSSLHREGSPAPVPMDFSGEMIFDGDTSASFYCSFQTGHQQWAHISGDKGHISIPDFVLPYFSNQLPFTTGNADFIVNGCHFVMERHDRHYLIDEYSNSHETAQETKMVRKFNELVLGQTPDETFPDMSLKTQAVLDACYRSAQSESRPVEPQLLSPAT